MKLSCIPGIWDYSNYLLFLLIIIYIYNYYLLSFFHIIVSDILSENIYVHTRVGIDDQYRPHYIIIPT